MLKYLIEQQKDSNKYLSNVQENTNTQLNEMMMMIIKDLQTKLNRGKY